MKEQKSVDKSVNKVYALYSACIAKYDEVVSFFNRRMNTNGDIIKWGQNNDLPEYIYSLYVMNTFFFRAINTLVDLTMGGGIELSEEFENYIRTKMAPKLKEGHGRTKFENERYKLAINMNGEDVHDVVRQQLLNYYLYGTSSLDIHLSKGFGKISEIYYRNVSTCRLLNSKKDIRISPDGWGRGINGQGRYDVPLFDPINIGKGNLYNYMRINNNESCPYPLPYYLPALRAIDIDNDISTYHKQLIKNGFSSTTIVELPAATSDDEMAKIAKNLKEQKTGAINAGTMLIVRNDGSGEGVNIKAAPTDNFDSKYSNLESNVERKILIGLNIHAPLIAGYNSNIGFNSQEFTELYKIQMDSVCIPAQNEIARDWEFVSGFEGAVKFKHSQMYKDAYGIKDDNNGETDFNTAE